MKFKTPRSNNRSGNNEKSTKTQTGRIKRHPDGFGFFIPEDPELPDVYIPRQSMDGIMTNDRVMVSVERERGGDRYRGEIIKILDRGLKTVVGTYHHLDKGGLLRDDAKGWGHDLIIPPGEDKGAKDGELVAVEITKYPDQGRFTGKVSEVIGDSMDPMNDIKRVILTQGIPSVWPDEVEREAAEIPEEVPEADKKGRRDLRKLKLITIDGATAKDFDDAIYVEQNDDGFVLYVAIADVSHYVRPDTAIDEEAYHRGTSVYFPNFVVPMLPEALSNGLCSLNPHVDRLCLVSEIHMDFQGEVQRTDFYEAIMSSAARVTYGEAQQILDGEKISKLDHVVGEIERAGQLAKLLMAKRFREGSLDLEIPEVQLVIDAGGEPIDILKSERLFAHRLIEEMMLAANVAVGKFLSQKEVPGIYRIHEPPNEEAIAKLDKFLHNFGGSVNLSQGKLQKRLTKALEEFSGKPEAQILNILALRSMSQAKYSPNNVGHFGLGFEFYTHFTSPIRRYPDLIVHRLVKALVMKNGEYRLMSEDDLATAGTMLSAAEQRSVKAERQVQAIKRARFMQKFIGQEFDGMISSVTKFGVFVLLRQFEVDGLVSLEKLGKSARDTYEFDPDQLRLVASRSGEAFEIGQMVRVRVAEADVDLGQVDFELVRGSGAKAEAKPQRSKDRPKGRMERFQIDELDLDQLPVDGDFLADDPEENVRIHVKKGGKGKKSAPPPKAGKGRSRAAKAAARTETVARETRLPKPGSLNDKRQQKRAGRNGPAPTARAAPEGRRSIAVAPPVRETPRPITTSTAGNRQKPSESSSTTPSSGGRFDPEAKLREALAKRGLTPTEALRNPESVKRLGAGGDRDSRGRRIDDDARIESRPKFQKRDDDGGRGGNDRGGGPKGKSGSGKKSSKKARGRDGGRRGRR
ncbi:MAG: ribonuclease R [Bdellovibrionaceae bacterium]|nr:ribonuclease R [Pseudobdellovibrionaceae bacterium]